LYLSFIITKNLTFRIVFLTKIRKLVYFNLILILTFGLGFMDIIAQILIVLFFIFLLELTFFFQIIFKKIRFIYSKP
jgi:hypothetical protein